MFQKYISNFSNMESNKTFLENKSELQRIKVHLERKGLPNPDTSGIVLRGLGQLKLKVHFRPDEGSRPIFDREEIIKNTIDDRKYIFRMIYKHEAEDYDGGECSGQSSQVSNGQKQDNEEKI